MHREWAKTVGALSNDHRALLEGREIGRPEDFREKLPQLRRDHARDPVEIGEALAQTPNREREGVVVAGRPGDEALVLERIEQPVDGRAVDAGLCRQIAGACSADAIELGKYLEPSRERTNVPIARSLGQDSDLSWRVAAMFSHVSNSRQGRGRQGRCRGRAANWRSPGTDSRLRPADGRPCRPAAPGGCCRCPTRPSTPPES